MRRLVLLFSFVWYSVIGISQTDDFSKYLEDQIYLTLSYDVLTNTPKAFEHNGFSGSFSTGFIKDIPLNKERNFGFGLGLGYGYSAYIQNLRIQDNIGNVVFAPVDLYKSNWLKQHKLELPIEIRFRGSTASKYKFWRLYTGIKLSYVIASKSKYKDDSVLEEVSNIDFLDKFQYGAILSAGFSTWNLYLYYGLKPIFKDIVIDNKNFKAKEFKIGLNFYIM